jgi:hypothetical protein
MRAPGNTARGPVPAFFAELAVPAASHRSTNVEQAGFQRSAGALFTRGLDELNVGLTCEYRVTSDTEARFSQTSDSRPRPTQRWRT